METVARTGGREKPRSVPPRSTVTSAGTWALFPVMFPVLFAAVIAVFLAALVGPLTAAAATRDERELVVMAEDSTLTSWAKLEELTERFESRHPGVSVRLLSLAGASGSRDKLKFLLAGNVPVDLTRIDVTELAAYVADDALTDLDPYFSADETWDPGAWFPGPLDAMRDRNGHLFGLPQTFTPYVMYVNESLLAAEGLERPGDDWTWSDLEDLCRRATRDTDGDGRIDQFGISITQWLQAVAPWIWQAGGDWIDEAGRSSRLAEGGALEALRFLHRMLHVDGTASNDATFANQLTQGLFQAGRTAFYGPVGYWETYRFRTLEAFDWDVLPLPRGERRATAVAMGIYVVPRTARHPDLAYAFLREVLGSEEYQREMAEIGNGVPGLVSAARSESFLSPTRPPQSERVFLDVLEHARFLPPLSNWRKIESLVQAELEGVLLSGRVSPEQAIERMDQKIDAYLDLEAGRQGRPELPLGVMHVALAVSLVTLIALFLLRRGPAPAAIRRREERHAYAMISLWAGGFLLFLFGPAVVSLVLGVSDWSPLRPLDRMRFVGTENFARLGADATFRTSLAATATYALLSVPLSLGVALSLALLLRRTTRLNGAVRTAVVIPAILSPVIVAAVWRFVLDEEGLLNETLRRVGIEAPAWLEDTTWVIPAFVVMSVWSVGAQMLVFLASLQALDPTLEDAARIDGAGPWKRFVHVVLPALTPVVLFNLLTGVIAAFQVFAQPYVMTQGGPGDSSRFLVLYLYETGFRHLDMGYASAIAWVLFGLLAVLSLVLLRTSHRWVHYAARGIR